MHGRRIAYIAAALCLAAAAMWFFPFAPQKEGAQPKSANSRVDRAPTLPSAPIRAPVRQPAPATPASRLREERRGAVDLKALFDRYRAFPDPTGEISFVLADIVGECSDFTGKSFEARMKYYVSNTRPTDHPDEEKRAAELKRRMSRCDGFSPDPRPPDDFTSLHKKALDAAYPGEVAREISLKGMRGPHPLLDEMAIHYLTEKVNADVVVELRQYMYSRTFPRDGRPIAGEEAAIFSTAWQLVACDFGANCGPDNILVYKTCLLYGACDLTSVDDVLRWQLPEETLGSAYAVSARLAAAIRTRNREGLGF